MFKKMKDAFGVGGASVDAVLATPSVLPGGLLTGTVNITGGDREQDMRGLKLSFECVAERETDDGEYKINKQFGHQDMANAGVVGAGQTLQLPFQIPVPVDCPPNLIGGTSLPGIKLGLRTRLDIASARDASDFDAVTVQGLPAQMAVLGAMQQLGFMLKGADLEEGNARAGHLQGQLGVYAEYEFHGQGRINEVEVTFVTTPQECGVLVEIDKRGRWGFEGGDKVKSFTLPTQSADVSGASQYLHSMLS
ncbi:MAG: sporulation protein [Solirubrobacteraceae bacterium]|nr:sporulation protein [Solirubrobacteraceae bacterium]